MKMVMSAMEMMVKDHAYGAPQNKAHLKVIEIKGKDNNYKFGLFITSGVVLGCCLRKVIDYMDAKIF